MRGVSVDVVRMFLVHIVHRFDILKNAIGNDPELKALARASMFKTILLGEYAWKDQEYMLLACTMCSIVQNMVTVA